MTTYTIRRKPALLFLLFLAALTACKKHDNPTPKPIDHDSTKTATRLSDEDSLKYLMYHIMQVSYVDGGRDSTYDLPSYYWYKQVPDMDPLSPQFGTAEELLGKITSYPIDPQTGGRIDRYSFLDRKAAVSGEIEQGKAGDFGMEVTYAFDAQNESYVFVLYADKNSPAGKLGIDRGWQIIAIDGTTNHLSYNGGANIDYLNEKVYGSDQTTFTFLKPNGKDTVSYTVSKAEYNLNPVLFDSIYTISGKKVGYFVFNTFTSVYNYDQEGNRVPTPTHDVIDRLFAKFTSAGIQDLIVDIRYNGGGAVGTAEYLDSLISPPGAAGKLMYQYLYNDKLTPVEDLAGLVDKVNFEGGGSLNLEHVFFITTGNTASASELTLNNLKPYRDVKIIGDTTYGKPVGFFGLTITDHDSTGKLQYLGDLYAINFETRNALNEGGYFNGIAPDSKAVDYVDVPWGNPSDDNLQQAFNYISTGSFGRVSATSRMKKDPALRRAVPSSLKDLRFNGMIDYRRGREMENARSSRLY